ncbi:unnamed protein product, partial [Allacma fusca]
LWNLSRTGFQFAWFVRVPF